MVKLVGQAKKMWKRFNHLIVFGAPFLMLAFCSCGKHESAAGTVGAAGGAAVGSVVSARKNKTAGTLVGGLIGNWFGREVGRATDKQEEREKQERVQKTEEMRTLLAENEKLRRKLDEKWCIHCSRKIDIKGANCCPYCGNSLIREKYCRSCGCSFAPYSDYQYCHKCPKGVLLGYR
jgi:hypothetical protein